MSTAPLCTTTFKLNNGRPGSDDEKALEDCIVTALKNGYRLLDTAQRYEVEPVVGRAIRKSGVPREEITVVTKFWGEWHHNPAEALEISLRDLELDYVDVFLMHWPWATTPAPECKPLRITESPTFAETWTLMEGLVGPKCRVIGVSNFTQKTLDVLLATAKIVPAVNQVELHALNPNLKLVPYCESKTFTTLGGSRPGANNEILTHPLFTEIAKAHGCSTGVVSLSWAVQRGTTVIPKSSSESRIIENIRLVTLTEDEMQKINDAHKTIHQYRLADHITGLMIEMDGQQTLQGSQALPNHAKRITLELNMDAKDGLKSKYKTTPQQSTMSVQKDAKWWDGHARSYAKKPVSDEAGYQRTLKRVTGFLKPTDRVLELGCGSGSTALNLAPAAQTYLATDISPTMIQIANDKIAASPAPNLSFRVASAETLAAEDARFHTVLGFNYLHLVRDLPGRCAASTRFSRMAVS
ncbi:unnamed protein product [Parascedosporium putredinis]|uniref:Uncharacterized protein n=1 Tax=Parascedosporium putredinis TaxID=1442378 RepID=A0A9P1MAI8_9PEZI|nr:unnamed protein product [Parascedosporium putredinis]CAI7996693.1 unnamed protein product [Parascedosporium putredinis]